MNIFGYTACGPFDYVGAITQTPGVYVVFGKRWGIWLILDVGQSNNVYKRLDNHDRYSQWVEQGVSEIKYAVIYDFMDSKAWRLYIENYIRSKANPLCGER